jgi:hypothetical protein
MLAVHYINGRRDHFPANIEEIAEFANKVADRYPLDPISLSLEDIEVSFTEGRIWAFDRWNKNVDATSGVDVELARALIRLAIDDRMPYDGIEDFFANFNVRFVP